MVALAAASSLGLAPTPATAAEAEIRNVALVLADDTYVRNADIVAELTPLLADVVARGVSLYFVTEFELAAPRWYWLDEEIVTKSLTCHGVLFGREMGTPRGQAIVADLLEQMAAGTIRMPIDWIFSLAEAAAAHRYAEEAHPFGRVIMTT